MNSNYDEEPVFYCKECLSLRIRTIGGIPNSGYCDECGSTEIASTDIYNWEKRYKHKYGETFITKNTK